MGADSLVRSPAVQRARTPRQREKGGLRGLSGRDGKKERKKEKQTHRGPVDRRPLALGAPQLRGVACCPNSFPARPAQLWPPLQRENWQWVTDEPVEFEK